MWETYRDVSKIMFPNAKIAVDSFHVMQNVNRAMNKVRCSIMAKYNESAISNITKEYKKTSMTFFDNSCK